MLRHGRTPVAATVAPATEPTLTPTQDLVLDVLIARHRTRENLWTFSTRHKRALEALEDAGLVNVMSGVVENTVRASLTPAGIKFAAGSTYISPIEQDLAAAETEIRALRDSIARRS